MLPWQPTSVFFSSFLESFPHVLLRMKNPETLSLTTQTYSWYSKLPITTPEEKGDWLAFAWQVSLASHNRHPESDRSDRGMQGHALTVPACHLSRSPGQRVAKFPPGGVSICSLWATSSAGRKQEILWMGVASEPSRKAAERGWAVMQGGYKRGGGSTAGDASLQYWLSPPALMAARHPPTISRQWTFAAFPWHREGIGTLYVH